jgi:hypothetical protein
MLMSTPAYSKNNSTILRGKILSSIVDMNANKITTLGTPTSDYDGVNKIYCDQNSLSGIPTLSVTLTSTNWNIVLANTTGVFDILVVNVVSGGACGRFTVMKNDPSRIGSITRWSSSASVSTFGRLEIRWRSNTGIELRKNNSSHDGLYKIRYLSVV